MRNDRFSIAARMRSDPLHLSLRAPQSVLELLQGLELRFRAFAISSEHAEVCSLGAPCGLAATQLERLK